MKRVHIVNEAMLRIVQPEVIGEVCHLGIRQIRKGVPDLIQSHFFLPQTDPGRARCDAYRHHAWKCLSAIYCEASPSSFEYETWAKRLEI
jgi:hypothetical protein